MSHVQQKALPEQIYSDMCTQRRFRTDCPFAVWSKSSQDTFVIAKDAKHYENMPIQIYRKFHLQKLKIFRQKSADIFTFLLKT